MRKNYNFILILISFVFVLAAVNSVSAAVGDVIHQLNATSLPVPGWTAHCSVGLAYDGTNLYYNRCGDPNIYEINPVSGALVSTFDTNLSAVFDAPNAMAYDISRNGIWFGTQHCDDIGLPIYFWDFDDDTVTLKFHVSLGLINPATGDSFIFYCFVDGLAFNANDPGEDDDEIWFGDDVNKNFGLFRPNGTLVAGYDASTIDASLGLNGIPSGRSGLAIGGQDLYLGNDGGGDIFRAFSDNLTLIDQFASQEERLEDMACDSNTFAPTEVMWVRHTPQSIESDDLITAFEIEPGSCTFGGGGEPLPVCGNNIIETGEMCDDGNTVNGDGCSAICEIEDDSEGGRMTGGGRLVVKLQDEDEDCHRRQNCSYSHRENCRYNSNQDILKVTHGFVLHCDRNDDPNRLQINWGKGNKFHLKNLTNAICTDDLSIDPEMPLASFDTYTGQGTGRYNNKPGAKIEFTLTDAGEPGRDDIASFLIRDVDNNIVLNVTEKIRGNHQAHPEQV